MSPFAVNPAEQNRSLLLDQLVQISRRLIGNFDLEPTLQFIIAAICEITLSEAGSILLYEEETGLLKFMAAPRSQKETLRRLRIPLGNSIAGQCFRDGVPITVQNTRKDLRHFDDVDKALNFETFSVLAVPLVYEGKTIGVVEAVNKRRRAQYTPEDVSFMETLAAQATLAIQMTRLHEQVRQAANNAEALDQMKANFISIASHELRTPLGLILGYASYLKEIVQDPRQVEQAQLIVDSSLKLKKIIETLEHVDEVEGAKTGAMRGPQRKTVAIDQMVQEVASSFETEARERDISIIQDVAPGELAIEGDGEKISIALSNLVKNAITFTNEGGHVLISAEKLPGYVKLSVVDDGIGIPANDLPHVFERFYQVESHMARRHGGMGLGLSVAKVMVEMHGGQIWAESTEGRGSNFSILLPSGGKAAKTAGEKKAAAFVEE